MANTKLPARLLDTSAIPALNVTGDLTVDTTTLKVDSTNNRVGIGSAAPANKLDIKGTVGFEATNSTNRWLAYTYTDNTFRLNYNGAGADEVTILSSGNVGIGTDSPGRKLHLKDGQIKFENTASGGWAGLDFSMANGTYDGYMGMLDSNGRFFIDVDSNGEDLTILQNGNVGIGNNNPNRQLSIKHASQAEIGFKTGSVSNGALIYYNDSENKLLLRAQETTDHIEFQTGGITERMRITNGGNVNIGYGVTNTQTVWPLHLSYTNNNGAHGGIQVKNTNAGTTSNFAGMSAHAVNGGVQAFYYAADYDTWGVGAYAGSASNHNFHLMTNNQERVRITNAGNVAIGNTLGNARLDLGIHGVTRNTTWDVSNTCYLEAAGGGAQNHVGTIPLTLARADDAATNDEIGMTYNFDNGNWSSTAGLFAKVEDASTAYTSLGLRTWRGGWNSGLTQLSAGEHVNTLQPGFFARGNTSQWLQLQYGWQIIKNGIAHGSGGYIGVNLTEGNIGQLNCYDVGSDFDPSNGRFTAPVQGKYHIHGSVYCTKNTNTASDYAHFLVYVNGAQINQVYTIGGHQISGGDFSLNIGHVLLLEQGDYVEWRLYGTGSNVRVYGDHLSLGANLLH